MQKSKTRKNTQKCILKTEKHENSMKMSTNQNLIDEYIFFSPLFPSLNIQMTSESKIQTEIEISDIRH